VCEAHTMADMAAAGDAVAATDTAADMTVATTVTVATTAAGELNLHLQLNSPHTCGPKP